MVLRSQSGAYRHMEHMSGTVGRLQRFGELNREDLQAHLINLNKFILQTQVYVLADVQSCPEPTSVGATLQVFSADPKISPCWCPVMQLVPLQGRGVPAGASSCSWCST